MQIGDDELHLHTIGQQPPVGISGSGILDAVSEMYSAGVIDFRGVLNANHPSVRSSDKSNEGREFLLVPAEKTGHGKEIVVSRSDVNEIQLAKGAIRAGIEILLAEAGISAGQIDRFIIAGAFGTYIDVQSAVRVGMFPNLALESSEQVGNAAGEGARQMLVSAERRAMAQSIAGQIDYIELSAHPAFFSQFSKALFFPTEA